MKLFQTFNIYCGGDENWTHLSLLAKQSRQPWYMHPLIFCGADGNWIHHKISARNPRQPWYMLPLEQAPWYNGGSSCIFERVPGIEPRSQAWKARVITVIRYPLIEQKTGFEPAPWEWKSHMLTIKHHFCLSVGRVGFEPTFSTSRYVYRMYKIPTVPADNKKTQSIYWLGSYL